MAQVIKITDTPAEPKTPAPEQFDVQDELLVVGFALFECGVAAIYWPLALILAGVIFVFLAGLISRSKRSAKAE